MSKNLKNIVISLTVTIFCSAVFLFVLYLVKELKLTYILIVIFASIIVGLIVYINLLVFTKQITKLSSSLDANTDKLEKEKARLSYILNNMSQGIVVLDSNKNIIIINDKVACLFDKKYQDYLGKQCDVIFDKEIIINYIDKALRGESVKDYELSIGKKTFRLGFNDLKSNAKGKASQDLKLAIIYTDITDLADASALKQKFISNASHELKSPLTTIIGYQQLISCGLVTDIKEIEDYCSLTIKEAKRMNEIVKEMLELSRIEGNLDSVISDVYLAKIITDLIDNDSLKIKNKNIKVKMKLDEKAFAVMNESHAYSLLNNLIENAIKYNVQGGNISITLTESEFIIKDTGIGISESDQKKIFERFFRSYSVLSEEGSGLGLAIVKHICSQYNFGLSVESKLKKGTTFIVKFK